MRICLTGGAGYIGSHTLLLALQAGHEVLVLDNLERGYREAIVRTESLASRTCTFAQIDLRDPVATREALVQFAPEAVIHCAAYKSVAEGEAHPQRYHENNVEATRHLLSAMHAAGTAKIIFSSSAAVYGTPRTLPLTEESPLDPINVYGRTKLDMERLIAQYTARHDWQAYALRYFNAIGAHPSGILGEDPRLSTNLVPLIMQVLTGQRDYLQLFGDRFDTADGTQERDYIHVLDLAAAHLRTLETPLPAGTIRTLNLSRNEATSCRNLIQKLETITGQFISLQVTPPRPGDPERLFADSHRARTLLSWDPVYSVEDALRHQWTWTRRNPTGYKNPPKP